MTLTYQCDRCKTTSPQMWRYNIILNDVIDGNQNDAKNIHLCNECHADFKSWIKQYKVTE